MSILLAGCTAPPASTTASTQTTLPSPPSTALSNLASLRESKTLAASLYGVVTFSFSGTTVVFPTQLFVPAVPIAWSGTSFSGHLEETGPGEDVTDEVSGVVSNDGNTALSLTYSRQVIRRTAGNGTFYRVSLKNVQTIGPTGAIGVVAKSGADVRYYVVKVEYSDGSLSGGQIVPNTTYVSTDWANTNPGQVPTLQATFAK